MHEVVASLTANEEKLRKHLSIAVIHGGDKDDDGSCFYKTYNPRAAKTYEPVARQIAEALQQCGYERVVTLPENARLVEELQKHQVDIVFCNSGGLQGYNPMSHLPALMEMVGLPYVGHNPVNATLLDNKHLFKQALSDLGIPTPGFLVCHGCENDFSSFEKKMALRFGESKGPFIVKPTSGRASIHVNYAETIEEAWKLVLATQQCTSNTVLVEEYLPGREFVVAISGPMVKKQNQINCKAEPFAFSVIERRLEQDEHIFTSMDKKAISAQRLLNVTDEELIAKINKLGQEVHAGLCLQGLIRVDLRMDSAGNLSVMEANPKPDLTRPQPDKTSLVCHGLPRENMTYEELIESQLLNAIGQRMKALPESIPHINRILH
ncbi:hypothetical protein M3P05_19615 [Sansalvadorimonas sp. 2012CJ34-2]|uniref:ATP-grasp domain-containing protein n=1 Tax=Parendozoicomonas callyspongiae TaxID=2942213 RepID=A0ABT0PL80_9GAMM|nr:hypothetical protein [Sansalvadorimonas sp. 2012CJ34-2]MCL6272132.1 hypothetical protein [Sansalvadorimonas sp. 2012CJ34-2]